MRATPMSRTSFCAAGPRASVFHDQFGKALGTRVDQPDRSPGGRGIGRGRRARSNRGNRVSLGGGTHRTFRRASRGDSGPHCDNDIDF
jgi:hypothetical protein